MEDMSYRQWLFSKSFEAVAAANRQRSRPAAGPWRHHVPRSPSPELIERRKASPKAAHSACLTKIGRANPTIKAIAQ
jgi:hypothetical protein